MGILFANHDKCKNMATQPTGWTTLQVGSPTRQMKVLSLFTVILIAIRTLRCFSQLCCLSSWYQNLIVPFLKLSVMSHMSRSKAARSGNSSLSWERAPDISSVHWIGWFQQKHHQPVVFFFNFMLLFQWLPFLFLWTSFFVFIPKRYDTDDTDKDANSITDLCFFQKILILKGKNLSRKAETVARQFIIPVTPRW